MDHGGGERLSGLNPFMPPPPTTPPPHPSFSPPPGQREGPSSVLPQLQHVPGGAVCPGRGVPPSQPGARRLQRLASHLRSTSVHLVPAHRNGGEPLPTLRVGSGGGKDRFKHGCSYFLLSLPPLLCPSASHSACVMQERKIYVFGGWDTPVCYNDMYMLDLGERSRHRRSKQTHV